MKLKVYKTNSHNPAPLKLPKDFKGKLLLISEISDQDVELNDLSKKIIESIGLKEDEVIHIQLDPRIPNRIIGSMPSHELNHVIVFGLEPYQLGFHFNRKRNRLIRIGNLHFIFTDSLKALNDSRKLKSELWSVLKDLFLHENN